jgi:TolB protein
MTSVFARAALLGGLVLAAAGCATTGQTYTLSTTGSGQALSRVTSETLAEYRPRLSPNGNILLLDVHSTSAGRLRDATIAGVDPATGGRRTIFTSTNNLSTEAAWLPDGSGFVYTTNSTGSFSLVRALSSTPNAAVTVILSGEVAPDISTPHVSPNGRRVAFSTRMRGTWQIGTANIDGSNFTLIGEGYNPKFSPDNRRIVFQRSVGNYIQLFSVDAETGTDLIQITSGDYDNITPDWSPDARYVVFASNRGGRKGGITLGANAPARGAWNLYALRPDGTGLVQLTDGDARAIHPHWAHDGHIYFSSNQAGRFDIWRLRPAGELVPTPAAPARR